MRYFIFLLLPLLSCQSSSPINKAQATPTKTSAPASKEPASAPKSEPTGPKIVDKFIPFGEERQKLTLEYIQDHYDPKATDINIEPKMIILHWTGGGGSAKGTIATFSGTYIESGRKEVKRAGALNVSAQFVIDRDGTIYRLMPETTMARHCIGLNRVAIGIENVGGGEKLPLTNAQLSSNIALVRYLKEKYPDIEYLIGHLEYRQFEGHPLFTELDPKYRNNKPDPGPEFMKKVREAVQDLKLDGPPEEKK
jgi:N-acetylmuramoyl-L-alanine amidase